MNHRAEELQRTYAGESCRAVEHRRLIRDKRRRKGRSMKLSATVKEAVADGARLSRILDLFAEDNRLNVYAGELEVRPPGAPTISPRRDEDRLEIRTSQGPFSALLRLTEDIDQTAAMIRRSIAAALTVPQTTATVHADVAARRA